MNESSAAPEAGQSPNQPLWGLGTTSRRRLLGGGYTLLSAALVSVTFIAAKQAMRELPPLGFTPIWFGVASLWGVGYYTFQPNKVTLTSLKPFWGWLLLLGLVNSAANYFMFFGINLGDPTVVSFFSRSETIFSLLLGILFLRERLTGRQWLGAAITIAGAGIMTYQGSQVIWIVLMLTVVANVFHALTSYIAKRTVTNVPPIILGLARTIVLTVTLGAIGFLAGDLAIPGFRTLLWIVGGSFFGPFLSFLFFYKGLSMIDMGQAAIIRSAQPLFVALYSFVLFKNTMGGLQLVGGLAILAGVILMLSAGSTRRIASIANPLLFYLPRKKRPQSPPKP